MASLVKAQIDLLALPFVRVENMEDEEGNSVEYICIPTKKAAVKRFKHKAILPIVVVPKKLPSKFSTHFVALDWSKELQNTNGKAPILGNGMIRFIFREQITPKNFSLSSIADD